MGQPWVPFKGIQEEPRRARRSLEEPEGAWRQGSTQGGLVRPDRDHLSGLESF